MQWHVFAENLCSSLQHMLLYKTHVDVFGLLQKDVAFTDAVASLSVACDRCMKFIRNNVIGETAGILFFLFHTFPSRPSVCLRHNQNVHDFLPACMRACVRAHALQLRQKKTKKTELIQINKSIVCCTLLSCTKPRRITGCACSAVDLGRGNKTTSHFCLISPSRYFRI